VLRLPGPTSGTGRNSGLGTPHTLGPPTSRPQKLADALTPPAPSRMGQPRPSAPPFPLSCKYLNLTNSIPYFTADTASSKLKQSHDQAGILLPPRPSAITGRIPYECSSVYFSFFFFRHPVLSLRGLCKTRLRPQPTPLPQGGSCDQFRRTEISRRAHFVDCRSGGASAISALIRNK